MKTPACLHVLIGQGLVDSVMRPLGSPGARALAQGTRYGREQREATRREAAGRDLRRGAAT